ncbi:hypothetical protein GWI33_002685 [Rhynchophorus ferrugineus]|uniref:Uncharacterized protein n=1 Tax=Rhynchophorus ferrugineus TaxID=354439 RepID=A0A834HLD8_RHYFE|nr:hypothetical protein GWI33_002685 [Rhynchophorus ferrugineus]
MSDTEPKSSVARNSRIRYIDIKKRSKDNDKLRKNNYLKYVQRNPLLFQKLEKACSDILYLGRNSNEDVIIETVESDVLDQNRKISSVPASATSRRKRSLKSRFVAKFKKLCKKQKK